MSKHYENDLDDTDDMRDRFSSPIGRYMRDNMKFVSEKKSKNEAESNSELSESDAYVFDTISEQPLIKIPDPDTETQENEVDKDEHIDTNHFAVDSNSKQSNIDSTCNLDKQHLLNGSDENIKAKGDINIESQLQDSNIGLKKRRMPILGIETTVRPNKYTVPAELLIFTPSEHDINKIYFPGTKNEVVIRRIFLHQKLTDEEQDIMLKFRKFCRKKNFIIEPEFDVMLLRILLYNKRKHGDSNFMQKSILHMEDIYKWRISYFPLSDTCPQILSDLKRGIMYWCGRDSSFRPTMIVRLDRMPRFMTVESFERLTIFSFEWCLRYLMIPGKVETCAVLVDARNVSLFQLPTSALKNMIEILTKQYPFRLNKVWIIHEMYFVQALWNLMKQFLTEVQQAKIAIFRGKFEKDTLKDYSLNQLEVTYGGIRPEITTFYPFPLASGPFDAGSQLESDEDAFENAWEACDENTAKGVLWEGSRREPISWSIKAKEIFEKIKSHQKESIKSEGCESRSTRGSSKKDVKDNFSDGSDGSIRTDLIDRVGTQVPIFGKKGIEVGETGKEKSDEVDLNESDVNFDDYDFKRVKKCSTHAECLKVPSLNNRGQRFHRRSLRSFLKRHLFKYFFLLFI